MGKWLKIVLAGGRELLPRIGMALAGSLTWLGVTLWFLGYLGGSAETPFALAGVTAAIGSILLVGWFVSKADEKLLMSTATLFLVATFGFMGLGLFSPALKVDYTNDFSKWAVVSLNVASWVTGGWALAWAVGNLVVLLPKLRQLKGQ